MGKHARLGPSNHRWPHCAGSVREEEAVLKKDPSLNASGSAAIDGTGSHLLLELCLKQEPILNPQSFLGMTIGTGDDDKPEGWLVKQDRITRVQICIRYIKTRMLHLGLQYPGSVVILQSESISNPGLKYGRSDWWGTCDVTLVAKLASKTVYVEVIDYKDGFVYVNATNNTQLLSYLQGKTANLDDITYCRMTIVQPKNKVPVRFQDVTTWSMEEGVKKLVAAAEATDDPNAPLTTGEHCRWCKRKSTCPALEGKTRKVITMNSELMTRVHTDAATVNNYELAEILKAEKAFIEAITIAKTTAMRRMANGQYIPGFFIGAGRAKNVWNEDDETIEKRLKGMKLKKDDIFPPKIITPAAAKKHPDLTDIQRKNLDKLITTMDGTDSIQEGNRNPASFFQDLIDQKEQ